MTPLKTVSEFQAAFILQGQDELPWRTVVCARRQVPVWWNLAKQKHQHIEFVHAPLCASKEPRFAANLWRFMRGTLPRCAGPVLFFCSEGRHRSGAVAALTQCGWLLATIAYLQHAGFRARAKELTLVLLLERKLRKINTDKCDCKR